MRSYPKFEEGLKTRIVNPSMNQSVTGTYGVIVGYDLVKNRATVILASQGSDQLGEILYDVICPTNNGVQGVSPEPGRMVWVNFKEGNMNNAFIAHYFNHEYDSIDYQRQNRAEIPMPRYLISM